MSDTDGKRWSLEGTNIVVNNENCQHLFFGLFSDTENPKVDQVKISKVIKYWLRAIAMNCKTRTIIVAGILYC